MKKWIALLLVAMMMLGMTAIAEQDTSPALGGRTAEQVYEELIVGSTTALSGNFFSEIWGNNTSDIDVRNMIHGYSPVKWKSDLGTFASDPIAVSGITAAIDANGNKTYTIALADNLRYSDGTAILASDYVFSILLSSSPEITEIGGATGKSDYILGMNEYALGEAAALSGVRLLSDTQFSITVRAEYLPFFYEMGLLNVVPFPIAVIAPGCEVADAGQGAFIRNIDTSVEAPVFTAELLRGTMLDPATGYVSHPAVTSGPYKLVSYDAQTNVAEFALNEYYKGDANGQKPTIKRVIFKQVKPETMMEQLKNGEVDLLNKCTQAEYIDAGIALIGEGNIAMKNYMRVGLSFISFNCEKEPFASANLRKAVAMSMDRDQFIADYVKTYGTKVNGYFGIGQWMTRLVDGTIPPPVDEAAPNDEVLSKWEELTLDELNPYALDLDAAKNLLIADGWTLDESGAAYDEAKGGVRAKKDGDTITKLEMTLIAPEGNDAVDLLTGLKDNLASIGANLTIETAPFADLLKMYYRQEPRENEMFYLGTNFVTLFDPTYVYSTDDANQGALNTTGLRDEKLMQLAMDMRKTEPGDVLAYCQKWLAFQTYWNEVLPIVPLYSNVYFDFHTDRLQEYNVSANETWSQAILTAYLSDTPMEDAADEAEPTTKD